jgi:hypothetical protein
MATEVVLGRVCIGTQHELGYAQFAGQRHLCLFGLQLLLDTLLGRRISTLDGVGDLFLDEVFFFRSSPFLFRTTFLGELDCCFSFLFLWLHLLFWCLGLLLTSFSFRLHLSTTCASVGGCYDVEYVDLSTLVRAHSS